MESRIKSLWLLNKGKTMIRVKLPSDNIIADKDLVMELDMDNSGCNKGVKNVKIMLYRELSVRNMEPKQEEEVKGLNGLVMQQVTNVT